MFLQDVNRWRVVGDVTKLSVTVESVQKKGKLDAKIFIVDIIRDNQLRQVKVLKQGLSRLKTIHQVRIRL